MKKKYFLTEEAFALFSAIKNRPTGLLAVGDYNFLLDQILKHNLKLGDYAIFGLDSTEDAYEDAIALLDDLKDRFS